MNGNNDHRSVRPSIAVMAGIVLAGVALVVFLLEGRRREPPVDHSQGRSTSTETADAPSARPAGPRDRDRSPRPASSGSDDAVPYIDGLVYGDVDLREARELMPDNLYWKHGAPTKDEKVLAEREQEKARRNQEYGRVLSGDANEDEVKAYYDWRRRLASDYVEFAEFMQRKLRDSSNEELRGLMDLALKMNAEKLRLLPGELEDALQRSRERAAIREDWRRQQEDFAGVGQPGEAPH